MTEKELRKKYVNVLVGWVGCKESDGSHKKIIDIYNSQKSLPRGYKVKYTDSWCATTTSAGAIKAGLEDIIPIECSCDEIIEIAKKRRIWQEKDSYVPETGDLILYDWDDNGSGNNKGSVEHIGAVVSVSDKDIIKVIEGNKSNAVGYREIKVNGKCIRGFVTPKYSSKATKSTSTKKQDKKENKESSTTHKVGDTVTFTGTVHYKSSNKGTTGYTCKKGKAKITAINKGTAHPYHLKAVAGKGSTVYGWVDAGTFK